MLICFTVSLVNWITTTSQWPVMLFDQVFFIFWYFWQSYARSNSFFSYFLLKYSWFTMLVPISVIQQGVPVIHTYPFFFSYLIFDHGLSQEIGYSFMCYIVGTYCLSFLNVIVCIYQPQTPHPSHLLPLPPGNHNPCLCVCFCFADRFICAMF